MRHNPIKDDYLSNVHNAILIIGGIIRGAISFAMVFGDQADKTLKNDELKATVIGVVYFSIVPALFLLPLLGCYLDSLGPENNNSVIRIAEKLSTAYADQQEEYVEDDDIRRDILEEDKMDTNNNPLFSHETFKLIKKRTS